MVLTEKEGHWEGGKKTNKRETEVDSDTAVTEDYLGNKIQIGKGKRPRVLSSWD